MQTYRLKVDPDGRVAIPNAEPGQTLVIQVDARSKDDHLTFATATTPEEKAAVLNEVKRLSAQLRNSLKPGATFEIDDLYGDDGLPK